MNKIIISLIFLFSSLSIFSQTKGTVVDKQGKPVAGVYVRWKDAKTAASTDINGNFSIQNIENEDELIFSNVAYITVTERINHNHLKPLKIVMDDAINLSEVTVSSVKLGKIKNRDAVFHTETLNANELHRAACCNLSESFETNASVDVSYDDAATGAKQIKLLGLSGIYVQMMTENIPALRGLSSAYGFSFIPGPWMESIQISKGTASVKNGYEAIAGQINVEYLKPKTANPIDLNTYISNAGRVETNATAAVKLNENLYTGILMHASADLIKNDDNKDGYLDMPLITQYNLANRWHYQKNGYIMQAFVRGLSEKRTGGETAGDYHIGVNTQRYEFFVKNGFVFEEKHDESLPETEKSHGHYSSLGVILSGSIHNQDAFYGNKDYNGNQNNLYANVLYDINFGKMHKLSVGTSFIADFYSEKLKTDSMTNLDRKEITPGVFAEYTLTYKDLSAVAGLRVDYNSLFGTLITPRIHLRYNLFDHAHLRFSAGKGYRAPNILAENNFYLASNRKIILQYHFAKPEESWNYGASVHSFIPMFGKELNLMTEWFYTDFKNQVVVDLDNDPHQVRFTGLNGKSYSSVFQVEANMEVIKGLNVTMAHRVNHVKTTYNGVLREKPLTNRNKSLISVSYLTKLRKWQFDFTTQVNGGGRMPEPDAKNPLWEKEFKPFTIMNGQITKLFKTWSVYAGVENMTGFVQKTPIIEVENPFGANFDASMVWGPMHGRTIYAGIRWSLERKNKKLLLSPPVP